MTQLVSLGVFMKRVMAVLQEAFPVANVTEATCSLYHARLSTFPLDVLDAATARTIDTWKRIELPPVGVIREHAENIQLEQRRASKASEPRALTEGAQPEEVRALIADLGVRLGWKRE